MIQSNFKLTVVISLALFLSACAISKPKQSSRSAYQAGVCSDIRIDFVENNLALLVTEEISGTKTISEKNCSRHISKTGAAVKQSPSNIVLAPILLPLELLSNSLGGDSDPVEVCGKSRKVGQEKLLKKEVNAGRYSGVLTAVPINNPENSISKKFNSKADDVRLDISRYSGEIAVEANGTYTSKYSTCKVAIQKLING